MSKLDLAIRGGTVVTASDTFRADVGVREGRIVAVAAEIKEATREIGGSGLLVLPGGIDSHVHIAQPPAPMSLWRMISLRRPPPRAPTPASCRSPCNSAARVCAGRVPDLLL